MAKPIRKTPSLHGAAAEKFLKQMIATEKRKINPAEKELLGLITSCSK